MGQEMCYKNKPLHLAAADGRAWQGTRVCVVDKLELCKVAQEGGLMEELPLCGSCHCGFSQSA